MQITTIIKNLFKKKDSSQIDLKKWNLMKHADPATLRTFAAYSRFEDFASALVYADKQIVENVLNAVSVIQCNNKPVNLILKGLIKKYSNITKEQSDRMKNHLMNNIFPKDYDITKNLMTIIRVPEINKIDWIK